MKRARCSVDALCGGGRGGAAARLRRYRGSASAADAAMQRQADLYQIDQIEAKFHKATSTHNLNLMMSLFAPGRRLQRRPADAHRARRRSGTGSPPRTRRSCPSNHWESDTPSYKIKTTVNGDKGTLYFECHYIDPKTQEGGRVRRRRPHVQKINGKWLIVDSAASTATLSP